jgi:hypothetical protein
MVWSSVGGASFVNAAIAFVTCSVQSLALPKPHSVNTVSSHSVPNNSRQSMSG